MTALLDTTALEGIDNYVGVHWRRGDRGHPEMGTRGLCRATSVWGLKLLVYEALSY